MIMIIRPPSMQTNNQNQIQQTKIKIKTFEETTVKNNRGKYKQQDDRLLKRLPLSERRRQEQLRKQIASDLMFQIA